MNTVVEVRVRKVGPLVCVGSSPGLTSLTVCVADEELREQVECELSEVLMRVGQHRRIYTRIDTDEDMSWSYKSQHMQVVGTFTRSVKIDTLFPQVSIAEDIFMSRTVYTLDLSSGTVVSVVSTSCSALVLYTDRRDRMPDEVRRLVDSVEREVHMRGGRSLVEHDCSAVSEEEVFEADVEVEDMGIVEVKCDMFCSSFSSNLVGEEDMRKLALLAELLGLEHMRRLSNIKVGLAGRKIYLKREWRVVVEVSADELLQVARLFSP